MSRTKEKVKIRKAGENDFNLLIGLINELADYEKLPRPDHKAIERLKRDGFGERPAYNVFVGEVEGNIVAYAIYFFTYSSFLASLTLYLEDIFVLPEYRSKGIGKELFLYCAKLALELGCGRMEWHVLDWNKLACDFYKKIGAKQLKEWIPYRLNHEELKRLVNRVGNKPRTSSYLD